MRAEALGFAVVKLSTHRICSAARSAHSCRPTSSPSIVWYKRGFSMCKHIINAKVSIQTPCCKRWYECPECHDEHEGHPQRINKLLVAFACKTCRKIFFKDLSIYGPEDSACPQCHTVFVSPAVTPEAKVAELALGILDTELNDVVSTSDF